MSANLDRDISRSLSKGDSIVIASAQHAVVITPSDSVDLTTVSRALWIGGAGNISVVMYGGEIVTISGIQAGSLLPLMVKRVNSTNTTATLIVSLW